MDNLKIWLREYRIVLMFTLAKLVIHLVTASNYLLHRDAYLYLAQSGHPDWSYYSTPPLLAFLIRIHTFIWGDSILAIRLLPALIGTASIFIVGWLIKKLKGGTWAQLIGLSAYLLSPAFLRPAVLLQPVILNHLFWLLSVVVLFQMVRKENPRLLLWMIPVLGLGWLAKYSIIFYGSALLAALLITPHRKLLWSRYLPITIAGGILLILPNLVWQHQHNWPVISHMNELHESQLGNVLLKDFLMAQLFMHLPALLVWMGGLIWLFTNRQHRTYRLFAWAYILTLLLIILLRGKFYYTIAAYTILVVFGGLAWEHWSRRRRRWIAVGVLGILALSAISILPFSLPIYPPERMVEYDRKQMELGLEVMLKWEDGEVHDLPQDYADMVGWDELAEKVWGFYDSLEDSVKARTMVYGENYGIAGSLLYYRPGDSYPQVHSFNDAFMNWIPAKPDFRHLIYIGNSRRLPLYFEELTLVGRAENPYFRETGLPIHFGSVPTDVLWEDWEESWQESVGRFTRHPNRDDHPSR
jgi:hypothetical protein